MVKRLVLKERDIEFVGHKARCNVMGEGRMSFYGRKRAGPATFVSWSVGFSDPQCKRRIVVEKE